MWKVHLSDTYLSSYVLLLLNKHIPFCQENISSFCISFTPIVRGLRVALPTSPQPGAILHTRRLFCPSIWVQNLDCQVFLHLFLDALSAMIQPSADELRFAWNLPHDLYYLLFSFLKINRIWGKVLGSELCIRTTDATNITLFVTVCASLSLRLSSSTELHLPITFGVCCGAVSPWSAVRKLNFTPSVPHHRAPGWQASCGVCIWLPWHAASWIRPRQDHTSGVWAVLPARLAREWGNMGYNEGQQHREEWSSTRHGSGLASTPGPLSMCSFLPPHDNPPGE